MQIFSSFPDLGDMHLNDDLITDYTTALMGPKANSLTSK